MKRSVLLLPLLVCALPAGRASQIGDAGHFIAQFPPDIFVNNPEGRPFTVTVHPYIWPIRQFIGECRFEVTGPEDQKAVSAGGRVTEGPLVLRVEATGKGVYRLRGRLSGYGLCWVECDLDQMVAHCGDIGPVVEAQPGYRPLMLHAIVPRRWYFYVPQGVESFEVQQVIGTWQSHREDHGIVVMSPRGQRVAALYGGLSVKSDRPKKPRFISRTIETDAGTTGRFWSIWATGGDSHCYTDMRIVLKGVPPYVAPTPEQWFDPTTGKAPPKLVYDTSQIRMIDSKAEPDPKTGRRPSTDRYLWAPAPFLGDEDFNGFRGPATVYLQNPDNREIEFGAGSYLVPGEGQMPVQYIVTDPEGNRVLSESRTFVHQGRYSVRIPPRGGGVYRMDVEAHTWYAWSEPAVPMVVEGKRSARGHTFALQLSIARHWFFMVPEGARQFGVSVEVVDPDHVLLLEIHAPDRLMQPLHVRGGRPQKVTIEVPPRLDGKIWFLRTEVGSPTRFVSENADRPRHVRIDTDLTLFGVPGYLAPTWGQWFDPTRR